MKDKKHMDRLFQEKLKDFEAAPGDSVWENISSELYIAGKDKKGSPVWWRVAGVAAGLLLIFTLWQTLGNKESISSEGNTIEQPVVDVETEKGNTTEEQDQNSEDSVDELVNESTTSIDPGQVSKSSPNNPVVDTGSDEIKSSISDTKDNLNAVGLVNENNDPLNSSPDNESAKTGVKNVTVVDKSPSESDLATAGNNNTNDPQNPSIIDQTEKETAEEILNPDLQNTKITDANSINIGETNTGENTGDISATPDTNSIEEAEELSLAEEIAANEEKEEDEEETKDFERWSAAPIIGPVYFNTLGNGSSIHPEFNNNSKTGDINLSYGISASYAISEKLSVRAGVHKVNLGYSTNDVVVYNNLQTPDFTPLLKLYRTIDLTEEAKNIAFINSSEFNFALVPGPLSNFIRASIDQKLGFIEIPLELKYKITGRKIGVNVIGGISTLILSDNEVYSVDNGRTILLGEATNLNNTSFSANFGLGFDFRMSDNINLNLEPVFKYQLNTFTDTTGDFKPFVIGVYSGLSFKF